MTLTSRPPCSTYSKSTKNKLRRCPHMTNQAATARIRSRCAEAAPLSDRGNLEPSRNWVRWCNSNDILYRPSTPFTGRAGAEHGRTQVRRCRAQSLKPGSQSILLRFMSSRIQNGPDPSPKWGHWFCLSGIPLVCLYLDTAREISPPSSPRHRIVEALRDGLPYFVGRGVLRFKRAP